MRNIFKYVENVREKIVPDTFLILVYSPKQLLHEKNSFENYQSNKLTEDYKKNL